MSTEGARTTSTSLLARLKGEARRRASTVKYLLRNRRLIRRRKVFYLLTPPPFLANVGDHAQAVAIRAWLERTLPGVPVIEQTKPETRHRALDNARLARRTDLVLLHSGGNLGDRGKWSESIRRTVIDSMPEQTIISLPQTIFFSDTPFGAEQRELTRQTYGRHEHLTVIARDPESGRAAEELFPNAETFSLPDFVLSLPPRPLGELAPDAPVVCCLRRDDESRYDDPAVREGFAASLGRPSVLIDTTLDDPIALDAREQIVNATLDTFEASRFVITDRYHGLIFSVLCGKATIVLPTVDHKLTSAMTWFEDVPFVRLAESLDEARELCQWAEQLVVSERPDWNALYFDRFGEQLKTRWRALIADPAAT